MKRRHVLLALNWYHPKLHRGIALFAKEHGWHLNTDMALNQGDIPWGWQGDGMITQPNARASQLRTFVEPFSGKIVGIGDPGPDPRYPHVANDDRMIAELAARHFLDRGFRRFAFYSRTQEEHPRMIHFAELLHRRQLPCRCLSPQTARKPEWVDRREAFCQALTAEAEFPVALFCVDDNAAAEALEFCAEASLLVPEQIAILGVRNDELICNAVPIPLSSIENNLEAIGRQAAELLQHLMDGETLGPKLHLVAPAGVVARQSTDILAVPHLEVARALTFIRNNYRSAITVNDVVKRAAISGCALYKAFHQHLGRTPAEEILRLRIEAAKEMLRTSQEKTSEIAQACGFGGVRVFYAAFSRATGTTPAQFRRVTGQSNSGR